MKIYFAPMEGMTDGILRQTHNRIFGGVDVYCLPFHKLTQSLSLLTREERDISPEENEGLTVLPQALTRDPEQLSAWLYYVSECGYARADLNIGCPSPTVTKRGRGSGLLQDPGYLRSFLDKEYKEENVEIKVWMTVKGTYEDTEHMKFKTLPAVKVASCIIKGSYDQMGDATATVASWINGNGYEVNGPMFNIYHVSPAQTQNPEEYVTEVCFPIG